MRSQTSYSIYACAAFLSLVTSGSAESTGKPQSMHATVRRLQQTQKQKQQQTIQVDTDDENDSKTCIIDGDVRCTSTYYVYKEFEDGGVTFAQARAATGYDADLESCVLAPIYSYQDLLDISNVIPPCKAAYTAAYKDPLTVYRESKTCLDDGRIPFNCDFSTLGGTLGALWGDEYRSVTTQKMGEFGSCSLSEWFGDGEFIAGGHVWCPALRQNWFNLGNKKEGGAIPPEVWNEGDSSFCGDGPIQNAAAAFATDYTSSKPTAALKAVNSGEYLPGAVYKCCQDVVTCYEGK